MLSANSQNAMRFHPVRSKSGSEAQAGLGFKEVGTTDDTDFTDSVGRHPEGWRQSCD